MKIPKSSLEMLPSGREAVTDLLSQLSGHPSAESIARYLTGLIEGEEQAIVKRHLMTCKECQELCRLEEPVDSAVAARERLGWRKSWLLVAAAAVLSICLGFVLAQGKFDSHAPVQGREALIFSDSFENGLQVWTQETS